jgi:Ca2+-dependent lipid-binding protein
MATQLSSTNTNTSTPTDRVEISVYAQKLKNTAGFHGVSDPYAVVTLLANQPGQQPVILGKTEVIANTLSPQWIKKFEVDYNFCQNSRVSVGIYDATKKGKDDKSMGSAVFEVGEVLGTRGNIKAKKLQKGGTLFCRIQKAQIVNQNVGSLRFKLRGIKLKNVGTFSLIGNHIMIC